MVKDMRTKAKMVASLNRECDTVQKKKTTRYNQIPIKN